MNNNGKSSVHQYIMKTFLVVCLISVVFQIRAETVNFKQIFQTPKNRDYDQLEILERSNFDDDNEKSSSPPVSVNDNTKASANAKISLRFGHDKLIPSRPLPPIHPCPCHCPYPPYHPTPSPCCCHYPYPHICHCPLAPPTPRVDLEQLLTDVSKALEELKKNGKTAPATAQTSKTSSSVRKSEENAPATAPVAHHNKILSSTKMTQTAPVAEHIDDLPPVMPTADDKIYYSEQEVAKQSPVIKLYPTAKLRSESKQTKEQLNKALLPHHSQNRADLLVSYPVVKSENHQISSGNGVDDITPRPWRNVIINEPKCDMWKETRPLPLPFQDPAAFLPPALPEIITITKPVIVRPSAVAQPSLPPAVAQPPLPPAVVPTLSQIIVPKCPHAVNCVCHCCTKYTRELNE